jgi:hypothetical protein
VSVALDIAIYSKLTGDTGAGGVNHATTGATGGFHNGSAPQDAGFPRIHFMELVTTAGYSFSTLISDHSYYEFTAFAVDGQSAGGTTAKTLIERVRTLLTDPSLTVTGKTVLYCRFERTVPRRPEWDDAGSRFVYSAGIIVEIWLN